MDAHSGGFLMQLSNTGRALVMTELGSSETEGGGGGEEVSCFNSNNVMFWNYMYISKIIIIIYSQLIH